MIKKFLLSLSLIVVSAFFLSACQKGSDAENTGGTKHFSALVPVSYLNVKINDNFWLPRIEKNRLNGIRKSFEACDYSLRNFDIAAGKIKGKHEGTAASDSDVYKLIQGAAYALHNHPDPELENFIDSLITRIIAAQQPDGYLYTYWTINNPKERWKDTAKKHELYCAGHMFEAAVAWYEATGKIQLLDAAIRLADHIDSIFGPDKRHDVPGHQEIELALINLYQATGKQRCLDLAHFFLEERGNPDRVAKLPPKPVDDPNANTPWRWRPPSYMQDHQPVKDQHYATGHAVRAAYMYAAMTDMEAITGAGLYTEALDSIWTDIVTQKLYITGAIGTAEKHDEGFGRAYLLPNEKAYCETCANIAFLFWNYRMNMLHGSAEFADLVELTLFNAGISGVSFSGDHFFYRNPLKSNGKRHRSPWFEPGCCPSNIARFLPHVGNYIYGKDSEGIYINQFIANQADIDLNGNKIKITIETDYPWEGSITIKIYPDKSQKFKLNIRVPGWFRGNPVPGNLYRYKSAKVDKGESAQLKLNNSPIIYSISESGYITLDRQWDIKDEIEIHFAMPVKKIKSHPEIKSNAGKIALQRGPVNFCLEEADNEADIFELRLPENIELTPQFNKDLLGGVMTLEGTGTIAGNDTDKTMRFTAIPYFSWANRDHGKMCVWIPEAN